jgi:hypothetical protein
MLKGFDPDESNYGIEDNDIEIRVKNQILICGDVCIDENWEKEDTYDVKVTVRFHKVSELSDITYTERELQDVIAEGFLLDA